MSIRSSNQTKIWVSPNCHRPGDTPILVSDSERHACITIPTILHTCTQFGTFTLRFLAPPIPPSASIISHICPYLEPPCAHPPTSLHSECCARLVSVHDLSIPALNPEPLSGESALLSPTLASLIRSQSDTLGQLNRQFLARFDIENYAG